jgi:hypothetical protein
MPQHSKVKILGHQLQVKLLKFKDKDQYPMHNVSKKLHQIRQSVRKLLDRSEEWVLLSVLGVILVVEKKIDAFIEWIIGKNDK